MKHSRGEIEIEDPTPPLRPPAAEKINDPTPPLCPLATETPADQEAATPTIAATRTEGPETARRIATPIKATTAGAATDPAATTPDETATNLPTVH